MPKLKTNRSAAKRFKNNKNRKNKKEKSWQRTYLREENP